MSKFNQYSVPIELRFADLDAYGHVNNATYFTFMETARTKLFHDAFIEFMDNGLLFLVVKAECEYKRPIDLTDKLVVSLEMVRVGNSSFDIEYRLYNGNETTFATAKTVMVCYDAKNQTPIRIPESFKESMIPG